ncbi:DUF4010 domain-containing protein [Sphingomonas sp.]|uniref:MgtC/SapB family protein n=1 Tax=Sphingomonas sp. TaxID=28214 RepID=UPI00286BBB48|nr:DUF4010 domain-containing protein [Sphingomonas sp.]
MIDGLDPWAQQGLRVGVGLVVGILVGLERGFKLKDEADGRRVAGVRTFSLLGLGGGIAGLIGSLGQGIVAAVLMLGAIGMLAIAYSPRLKAKGDATSPVAAVATLGIAYLAGFGLIGLALAASAIVVLILAMRDEVHGFVDRLDERDIKSLARFAVIALAVLPFLPSESFGPYDAWNPFKLWWVVVLVTGFSFVGYIANRIFGARHGTIATALIGGAYSSTAVTQSLAQRLGTDDAGGAEPAGIALASAVMYLRVLVLVAVLANRMLVPLAIIIAPALVVAWAAGWWLYRRAPDSKHSVPPGNPIALLPALTFLAFVAGAAVAARWAQGQFGEQGIALLLFLMGSMDVDASIVTAGGLPEQSIGAALAAIAIGGTVVANMAVKIGVTLAYARAKGRSSAIALGASSLTLMASLAVAWLSM